HRKLKVLTPYHPEAWDWFLRAAGIYNKYPYVVPGIRQGFIINLPLIHTTQAPPNWHSVIEFAKEFSRIVEHEIAKQHYIGPISRQDLEALIGPFQLSPFSIILKPGKADKYHNIQNYSF